jgi:hypothetical protein
LSRFLAQPNRAHVAVAGFAAIGHVSGHVILIKWRRFWKITAVRAVAGKWAFPQMGISANGRFQCLLDARYNSETILGAGEFNPVSKTET